MASRRLPILLIFGLLLWGGASPALAGGALSVSFTTTAKGGPYAPRNVVAVWIENAAGGFVKTIGRWAGERRQHLVAWRAKAGAADADAVSGATRNNHTGALTVPWDLLDKAGAEVPDGTYTIRMELADANSSTAAQNNQGTFTFVKGPAASNQSVAGGGFTGVTIDYTVAAATCGNGTLDAGETCDPVESCPTTCDPGADACAPLTLSGAAATCTAACVATEVTTCAGGDGCCPTGCDAAGDDDCAAGPDPDPDTGGPGAGGDPSTDGEPPTTTEREPSPIAGGCTAAGGAGGGGAGAVVLAGLALLVIRSRRWA
jgi:hypothetical protein